MCITLKNKFIILTHVYLYVFALQLQRNTAMTPATLVRQQQCNIFFDSLLNTNYSGRFYWLKVVGFRFNIFHVKAAQEESGGFQLITLYGCQI